MRDSILILHSKEVQRRMRAREAGYWFWYVSQSFQWLLFQRSRRSEEEEGGKRGRKKGKASATRKQTWRSRAYRTCSNGDFRSSNTAHQTANRLEIHCGRFRVSHPTTTTARGNSCDRSHAEALPLPAQPQLHASLFFPRAILAPTFQSNYSCTCCCCSAG
jgi:hypothetical protein